MLLAGDIGATKTILAVYAPEGVPGTPLAEATFVSAEYPSLEALVQKFLAQAGAGVERASFGVAGPVVGGRVTTTNLPWVIDEEHLRRSLNLTAVRIANDLEAIARAVPELQPSDLYTLHRGEPVAGGTRAVVAPGTGLGEAFLVWDGARYRAHASEGGHTDFAPTSALEVELLGYLQQRLGHVSYERICSGLGVPNIYAFLKDNGHAEEPVWMAERLRSIADPTPLIIGNALDRDASCALCRSTLDIFVSVLGSEAGNLALKVLATGGLYLGGGIPPRILSLLEDGPFLESFRSKGRMSDLLSRVPVHVILNPTAALLGAACLGLDL
jgi:glucokinase